MHLSTICRLLSKHGFTIQHVALQRTMELRAAYMASVYVFTDDMLDESESDSKSDSMVMPYEVSVVN